MQPQPVEKINNLLKTYTACKTSARCCHNARYYPFTLRY